MKNTRTVFGNIEVINPALVIKAGLVYDHYKRDGLEKLWKESERRAPEKMPTFKPEEFFFQEELQEHGKDIWYSFRYYTPKSNIKASHQHLTAGGPHE